MRRYILARFVQAVAVLVQVAVLVFLLMHLAPGDPIELMSDQLSTREDIATIRASLALDRPILVQLWLWLSRALRGDLGRSLRSGLPVAQELAGRFPYTVVLTLSSMALAVVLGVTAGVAASLRRGSWFDTALMVISVLGVSIPPFWLGLLLILLFAVILGWLPSVGGDTPWHLILPALSLGTSAMALIARMTRSTMLEVAGEDFVRTARAKGLVERRVVYHHALRNALIPTVTIVGLQFGTLLAGAVITEAVFAWPGLGRLVVQSILNRDFPVVQGCLLAASASFIMVNLWVDVLYAYLDPRIRYG
ncbi:MAG: ABC transporter permease [Armatimonadetes bacterium]|nr:ABC transporter permease [Armatimonadota bacterium]